MLHICALLRLLTEAWRSQRTLS